MPMPSDLMENGKYLISSLLLWLKPDSIELRTQILNISETFYFFEKKAAEKWECARRRRYHDFARKLRFNGTRIELLSAVLMRAAKNRTQKTAFTRSRWGRGEMNEIKLTEIYRERLKCNVARTVVAFATLYARLKYFCEKWWNIAIDGPTDWGCALLFAHASGLTIWMELSEEGKGRRGSGVKKMIFACAA